MSGVRLLFDLGLLAAGGDTDDVEYREASAFLLEDDEVALPIMEDSILLHVCVSIANGLILLASLL